MASRHRAKPEKKQISDLRFAWEMVRHVKSNAIVLCKDGMLLGAGAGQMSRVDSVEIAVKKAGNRSSGTVMGSDAFFPFPDSIDTAAAAGVVAVIQPGGSKNDADAVCRLQSAWHLDGFYRAATLQALGDGRNAA